MTLSHRALEPDNTFSQLLRPKIQANSPVLGRLGSLVVRLAITDSEKSAAQALRHQVFHSESNTEFEVNAKDTDRFDAYCDHLIVIDTELGGLLEPKIVGTYRLLREKQAALAGGFYSQAEFDVAGFASRMPGRRILELGRSCVLPKYRSRRAVELLWHGIWACSQQWSIDVLFGCASFRGTNAASHALPLSYLYHHARAPGDWQVKGHKKDRVDMDLMPVEAIQLRAAMSAMPPLIKGYLRVGALFGDSAVVDHDFGTTDVFVILPVEQIAPRYISHFGVDAERFA